MTAAAVAPSRAEINRRNAKKSTGPRTAAGRERVRFNALKHGLRAKTLVLPDEDEGAYLARLEAWTADIEPRDEVERFLVARAVQASWKLDRVERARAARRQAARFADAESTAAQAEEVAALGRRLFWISDGPTGLYPHPAPAVGEVQRVSYSSDPEDPDDPARLVVRLESMTLGCAWLLDRWGELRDILEAGLLWQPPDRLKAIRMLGRQPLEAVDDRRVMAIYLGCWAMDPEDQHGFTDLITELTARERAAYLERLNGRDPMASMPESPEAARSELLALIAGEEERLEQALGQHLERVDAELAAELAFDDSAWGERLRKHELSNDRTLLRILETLRKRRQEGDAPDSSRVRASSGGRASVRAASSDDGPRHDGAPPEPLGDPARGESHPLEDEGPSSPQQTSVGTGLIAMAPSIGQEARDVTTPAGRPAAAVRLLAGTVLALFALLFLGGFSAVPVPATGERPPSGSRGRIGRIRPQDSKVGLTSVAWLRSFNAMPPFLKTNHVR